MGEILGVQPCLGCLLKGGAEEVDRFAVGPITERLLSRPLQIGDGFNRVACLFPVMHQQRVVRC